MAHILNCHVVTQYVLVTLNKWGKYMWYKPSTTLVLQLKVKNGQQMDSD